MLRLPLRTLLSAISMKSAAQAGPQLTKSRNQRSAAIANWLQTALEQLRAEADDATVAAQAESEPVLSPLTRYPEIAV